MTAERTGQRLQGRWDIGPLLASGGHSDLYKALDTETGRDVAVKVLKEGKAGKPEYAVRLAREYRAMMDLDGTSAVRAHALSSMDDGTLCLVMELLVGVDFDDLLTHVENHGHLLELAHLVEVVDPLVDTLEVAHGRGILHRDLKPANIYVLETGGVRLLDFGLAKIKRADPITEKGTIMGSPSYIAPEAWAGRPSELDRRVDVYSLGAIIFRALSGEVPFPGKNLRERVHRVKFGERPSLVAQRPELPLEVDDWVRQVLAVDRDSRFSHIRAMWNAFLLSAGLEPDFPRPGVAGEPLSVRIDRSR